MYKSFLGTSQMYVLINLFHIVQVELNQVDYFSQCDKRVQTKWIILTFHISYVLIDTSTFTSVTRAAWRNGIRRRSQFKSDVPSGWIETLPVRFL